MRKIGRKMMKKKIEIKINMWSRGCERVRQRHGECKYWEGRKNREKGSKWGKEWIQKWMGVKNGNKVRRKIKSWR